MDVRAAIAQQLVRARAAKPTQGATGERGSRWVTQETGMHRDKLLRIERGTQTPTLADLQALCTLYGVTPSELPIMAHRPSKRDQAWAREQIAGLTAEQAIAIAWVFALAVDETSLSGLLDGEVTTHVRSHTGAIRGEVTTLAGAR